MSQHDLVIDNDSGIDVRLDINQALQALGSMQMGPAAPSPAYPCQLWADTTTGLIKMRNSANTAWIVVGKIDVADYPVPAGGGIQASLLKASAADGDLAWGYPPSRQKMLGLTNQGRVCTKDDFGFYFIFFLTSGPQTLTLFNQATLPAGVYNGASIRVYNAKSSTSVLTLDASAGSTWEGVAQTIGLSPGESTEIVSAGGGTAWWTWPPRNVSSDGQQPDLTAGDVMLCRTGGSLGPITIGGSGRAQGVIANFPPDNNGVRGSFHLGGPYGFSPPAAPSGPADGDFWYWNTLGLMMRFNGFNYRIGPANSPLGGYVELAITTGANASANAAGILGSGRTIVYMDAYVVCATAELGFAVGTHIKIDATTHDATRGCTIHQNPAAGTQVNVNFGSAANVFAVWSTGVTVALTNAKWRVRVYVN